MKIVTWTDDQGWQHRSLLRDDDPDSSAPQGIPQDPPDLHVLDWDGIRRDLHNELVAQGILTWSDLERSQGALSPIIVSTMRRHLISLYKQTREV